MASRKQQLLERAFSRDYTSVPQPVKASSESPSKRQFRVTDFPSRAPRPLSTSMAKQPESLPVDSESHSSEESEEPTCSNKPLSTTKPVPFLLLENYISEVCTEIEHQQCLSNKTLKRAKPMVKALDDCTKAMPSLSIFFYNLARSILRDLSQMQEGEDCRAISNKMLELASFIYEKRFRSNEHPVSKYEIYLESNPKPETLEEVRTGLGLRMQNITAKNLGVISKVLRDDQDMKLVVRAFMILLQQLDSSVARPRVPNDPLAAMVSVSTVPARAVQATRKLFSFIENDLVSAEAIQDISALLQQVSLDKLTVKEKTGVGVMVYEFLDYTVKYWQMYAEGGHERPASSVGFGKIERAYSLMSSPERPRMSSLSTGASPVQKKSLEPRKKRKPKPHVFADPEKQRLFQDILGEEKLQNRFKQYLQEKFLEEQDRQREQEDPELEALKVLVSEKKLLVNGFIKQCQLSEEVYDRLLDNTLFLSLLEAAMKLASDSASARLSN